jgi:dTDP-4-dehydrorhamnose 3,5-epimerase
MSMLMTSSGISISDAPVADVRIIEAARFDDERGWFAELWNARRYAQAGLDVSFVQDNVSYSRKGVLRGLHFQSPVVQAKLVCVLAGAVFDVVVDVRVGSPTFGRWFGSELTGENRRQLYIPEGCAHGFLVLSDEAYVHYDCTAAYDAASDRALRWNDADVAVEWPLPPAIVSSKDSAAPTLRELSDAGVLPAWKGKP